MKTSAFLGENVQAFLFFALAFLEYLMMCFVFS